MIRNSAAEARVKRGAMREEVSEAAYHLPVLRSEVLSLLDAHDGGVYFDGTLGGGGHAEAILEASSPAGRLYGVDRDPEALEAAHRRLARFGPRFTGRQGAFEQIDRLEDLHSLTFDGALLDLGVSSHQIDTAVRGFAYDADPDTPLDMRMAPEGPTAADLLNDLSIEELAEIFRRYGEEPFAGPVARAVAAVRRDSPVTTVGQLKEILRASVPAHFTPVKVYARAFQALRIAVNDELARLDRGLRVIFDHLNEDGRLAVLSYHSLEDRRVKRFFRELSQGCECPPDLPVCACGKTAAAHLLTRRAVQASSTEVAENPRARSARLRAITKQSATAAGDPGRPSMTRGARMR